ncbi:hypothetical protein H0X06_06745 [Candidatus Dependentiae bacterium]|nr:hypothetical protein [Candidatus Dependentiae bacterium]
MQNYRCTCLPDSKDKNCLHHRKKLQRTFWKEEDSSAEEGSDEISTGTRL